MTFCFVLFYCNLSKRIFQHGTYMNHGMHRNLYKKMQNALLDVVSCICFFFHLKLNLFVVISILFCSKKCDFTFNYRFNFREFSEYSMPMVDHAIASRTNIERLRQVYHQLYKYRDPSMDLHFCFNQLLFALVIVIFNFLYSIFVYRNNQKRIGIGFR